MRACRPVRGAMTRRTCDSVLLCSLLSASLAAQGQKQASGPPRDREFVPGLRAYQRIHPALTPFPGTRMRDELGSGLAMLGDVDGNGYSDLALGASADAVPGGCWQGAVWIQFFGPGGLAIGERKICPGEGGFSGEL